MICQQPHNNIMHRVQLRYAADNERYTAWQSFQPCIKAPMMTE